MLASLMQLRCTCVRLELWETNHLSVPRGEWVKNLALVRQESHLVIVSGNQSWRKFGNLTSDQPELYPYQSVNIHQSRGLFPILPDTLMCLTSFQETSSETGV